MTRTRAALFALLVAALGVIGMPAASAAAATAGHAAFAYTGTWGTSTTDHYSNDVATPATARINFTAVAGATVSLKANKNSNNHLQTIRLDGAAPVTVNLNSSTTQTNVTVWTSAALAAGDHTLTVTVTQGYGSVAGATLTNGVFGGAGYVAPPPPPPPTGGTVPNGPAGSWALSFDDEFDTLNTSNWALNWYAEGGSMNGVGTYARNVSVVGGELRLRLESRTAGALVHTDYTKTNYRLPVGSYVEARVWFPGDGTRLYNWPAFWASSAAEDGWPSSGEHDIAEVLGGSLTVNYHSPSGAHNQGAVPGYWGGAWHTYGLLRKAGSAEVYWDGRLVKSYPTDDNGRPEILILNVGAGTPAAYGDANAVRVDYVRAWAPA